MKKSLIEILIGFGFNKPQARLFYTGYIHGAVLMAVLARLAKVPRGSAYYNMKELIRRGFFRAFKKGKRIYYQAASGSELLHMVRERELLIKEFLLKMGDIKKQGF